MRQGPVLLPRDVAADADPVVCDGQVEDQAARCIPEVAPDLQVAVPLACACCNAVLFATVQSQYPARGGAPGQTLHQLPVFVARPPSVSEPEPSLTSLQRREQEEQQRCCISYDVFPVSAGLRCESIAGHFICADCAPREVQRILEAIQEAEPLARHRAQGGYIVCVQQDCGAQYAEPALARVLPDALCRRYRAAQNAVVEQRLFEELQQGFQEQIEAERREFENANNVVRQGAAATAEFLRRQYPNAVQCPRCHAGPVIPENCYNLQTHHGESSSSGRGRISNACPGCGFFSRDHSDWVSWDGHMRGAL